MIHLLTHLLLDVNELTFTWLMSHLLTQLLLDVIERTFI